MNKVYFIISIFLAFGFAHAAEYPAIQLLTKEQKALDKKWGVEGGYLKRGVIQKNHDVFVSASKYEDHRIIFYSQPSLDSTRLMLVSIFTQDVEGNPFNCKFGSHYVIGDSDTLRVTYTETIGDFIKVIIHANDESVVAYSEIKLFEFW